MNWICSNVLHNLFDGCSSIQLNNFFSTAWGIFRKLSLCPVTSTFSNSDYLNTYPSIVRHVCSGHFIFCEQIQVIFHFLHVQNECFLKIFKICLQKSLSTLRFKPHFLFSECFTSRPNEESSERCCNFIITMVSFVHVDKSLLREIKSCSQLEWMYSSRLPLKSV